MPLQSIEFAPNQPIRHNLPPHGISARFFCNMYSAFGIEPADSLKQFTYGICELSRIVDDAIDLPDIETPPTFHNLTERLNDNTLQEMSEADRAFGIRYIESLGEDQLARVGELYLEARAVAERRTSAANLSEYAKAITEEAVVQCGALAVSESADYRDLSARQRYNKWLPKFILAGYFIDSALDLTNDHNEDRTRVRPSTASRIRLLNKAVVPGLEAIADTPPKAVPLLASMAIGFHIKHINKGFSLNKIEREPELGRVL